ncbi:MAG: hypothetical protein OEW39_02480 [Deltaproteobacteria bacterium]|nr:hypothetical protein [Deltaproteobacteria bacterium]
MTQKSTRFESVGGPRRPTTPAERGLAFLAEWKPFKDLPPNSHLRRFIPEFLQAGTPERRRELFLRVNTLFKVQGVYKEQGLLREGKNERMAQFEELFKLSAEALGNLVAEGHQRHALSLLQFGFEFGRHPASNRQLILRDFLLILFSQNPMDPALKFCLYPGGVLYTAGGKSHDELVQDFRREGLGSGAPMAGGLMWRKTKFAFTYDLSSTAFGRNSEPGAVKTALLNAVRSTGGDDTRLNVSLEPPRQSAI